jgi:hypothetical protein
MQTSLEPVKFGDGTYKLGALSLKQIVELERACGHKDAQGNVTPKSIYQIHAECEAGLGFNEEAGQAAYFGGGIARPMDIYHTVRLLLIAGNSGVVAGVETPVGPQRAAQLCDDYLYPYRPLIEGQYLAWAGLNAMIVGIDVKKKEPAPGESLTDSPEASS